MASGGRGIRGKGRGQSGTSTQGQRNTRSTRNSGINSECTCFFCSSVVGNDAIGCDQCSAWFHPKTECTGLSKRAIDCIQAEGGAGIRFICSACRCITPSTSQSVSLPDHESLSQLHLIVKSLAESVAQLTTKVNMIINSNTNTNQQNSNFSRESLYTEMREFEERKKRRESLIIRGVRGNSDIEFSQVFTNICQSLVNSNVTPDSIYCVNRESGMFRVAIRDNNLRKDILSNSKRLKDIPEFRQIYISRDFTYVQRQEMRARRLERLQGEGNDHNGNSDSQPPLSVASGANIAPIASTNL